MEFDLDLFDDEELEAAARLREEQLAKDEQPIDLDGADDCEGGACKL